MTGPSVAVLALLLLAEPVATAQPIVSATISTHHTVVLSETGQSEVPELAIAPRLLTSLFFDASLRIAGVELEERDQFSRVTVLEDALLLVPSPSLLNGRRLRLQVRFVEGTLPVSANFVLWVDSSRTESHQVNIELRQPVENCMQEVDVERAKTRQCQSEMAQERQRPQGLTGLLAMGLIDESGVIAREFQPLIDFTRPTNSPIDLRTISTYRAAGLVAVALRVVNRSGRPWTLSGAELVGQGGARLRVLRVWPREPLPPGVTRQRIIVEAEAARTEARDRFQLSLKTEGEPSSVVVDGVAFP